VSPQNGAIVDGTRGNGLFLMGGGKLISHKWGDVLFGRYSERKMPRKLEEATVLNAIYEIK